MHQHIRDLTGLLDELVALLEESRNVLLIHVVNYANVVHQQRLLHRPRDGLAAHCQDRPDSVLVQYPRITC